MRGGVRRPGLAPEYVEFTDAGMVTAPKGRHNLLRPEAMEAMFVLWRATGREVYREWGWQMFQAFERHCKVRAALPAAHLLPGQQQNAASPVCPCRTDDLQNRHGTERGSCMCECAPPWHH